MENLFKTKREPLFKNNSIMRQLICRAAKANLPKIGTQTVIHMTKLDEYCGPEFGSTLFLHTLSYNIDSCLTKASISQH